MKHTFYKRLGWAAVLGAAVMLAACSDSDDYEGDTAPPPVATGDVPGTAQANSAAWTTFVGAQAKSETGKGLDLTGVVAPFSESEAPQPI